MTTVGFVDGFDDVEVSDGDVVAPALIPRALTAGELVFSDGDGHFGSFWPPSYRASYELRWMVENGAVVGLRFTELGRGSRVDGRYRD
jgi:hypothetical protein